MDSACRFLQEKYYLYPVVKRKKPTETVTMQKDKTRRKRSSGKISRQTGLVAIVLAALLLEAISGAQYYYTRDMLERQLEQQVLTQLMSSALRMDGIMRGAEASADNEVWHAERHLNDPEYMEMLVRNLVKSESDRIVGASIAFIPNFYAGKGYWYEPYARQKKDGSISSEQIGSEEHNYLELEFYKTCIKGDTMKWCQPYMDDKGARAKVTTFSMPIRDKQGKPVAVLGVDVTTEWINETVNRHRMHPSSFTFVATEQGEIVSLPDDSLCSREQAEKIVAMIADSTVEKQMKAKGRVTSFAFQSMKDGSPGHVYYARKRNQPKWVMVTVCFDEEAFGELDRLRRHILWFALAGLLVLGLIVQQFAKNRNRLQQSEMKQERIDGELKIAQDIQGQMLPSENSLATDDVRLHGSLTSAREVGGDLYDFFIRDEKLFFCIGDVSGKGIPAAFIMGVMKTLFHSIASHTSSPGKIMDSMNETACRNNKSNIFVTMFVGVLDLPTGHLRYCNAGHEVPMVIDGKNGNEPLPTVANLPVGLFSDFRFEMQETTMQPGATLLLYTDGLTEARNSRHQMFGKERVKELAARCCGMEPKQITKAISDEVERFAQGTEQSDDLTLLVVKYTPKKGKAILDEELTLPNDVKEVARLNAFVKDALTRLNIGRPLAPKLRLAVEEAVVNVMEYAYPADSKGDVNIRITCDGERLRFIISDTGISFNPTEAKKADTTLTAEERPVGGLGILLIRELMDSVNYERVRPAAGPAKNVLTLTKELGVRS